MSQLISASIGILTGGKNSRLNGLKKWELKINNTTLIERSIKISKCFEHHQEISFTPIGDHGSMIALQIMLHCNQELKNKNSVCIYCAADVLFLERGSVSPL